MKRSNFLLFCVAAVPLTGFTKKDSASLRVDKGFKVSDGEGRGNGHIKLKGVNSNILDVKVSGKDTNGDLAIFEQTGLSPNRGTPLHIHPAQDEIFKIIEGEYYFQVGTDKYLM